MFLSSQRAHRVRYTNPVYPEYFADPFAWRSGNEYFAIGTGPEEAAGSKEARIFPLLRSRDLVHWTPSARALVRPDVDGDTFWAPEIAHAEGRFWLYYSVGHADKDHQLRVASSTAPEGPYVDCGALTNVSEVPFAIDPHPFRDDDGRWYLFHARDFLDTDAHSRAGTALVVHELESMTRLSPNGRTVLRAHYDWQLFKANRLMYGRRFDWHTLEGPFVVKHGGRYYCLYSGGCWEGDTYGVDYGVADHVLGPYDDRGAENGPRVVRTVPGRVLGPGHCSVARAPDERTHVLVYHAWDADMRARTMRIDPLRFTENGPRCDGPSFDERTL